MDDSWIQYLKFEKTPSILSQSKQQQHQNINNVMSIITAAVTKSTRDSKIGVIFDRMPGGNIYVKKILDGSLFEKTDLRIGMEILEINDQSTRGKTITELVAFIGATPKELKFHANWGVVKLQFTKDGTMNLPRNEMPSMLKNANVPFYKWERIYMAVRSNVVKAVRKSNFLERIYQQEMDHFVCQQLIGAFVGFGMESRGEKRTIEMVHTTDLVANHAMMLSYNALVLANSLLNPHGISAQMILVQTELSVTHLKTQFHSSNCYGLEFEVIGGATPRAKETSSD